MGKQVAVVLYAVAMVAIIVGVDFAFFRNRSWERLTVNIGIVLVFAAFYLDSSGVHDNYHEDVGHRMFTKSKLATTVPLAFD